MTNKERYAELARAHSEAVELAHSALRAWREARGTRAAARMWARVLEAKLGETRAREEWEAFHQAAHERPEEVFSR